jgi:hypothetical protein
LSEATLRLTITHNEDDVWWNRTEKLSKFPGVIRRDHHEYIYGGPLKEGQNDILTDFPLLWVLFDPGNYTLDVEAKLPDDRVLFSFAGTVYLESDWDW